MSAFPTLKTRSLLLPLMLALVAQHTFAQDGVVDGAVTATMGADGVQRVSVTMTNYAYTPSRIIVQAGKPVELTLTKDSGFTPHDFVIDDPEAGFTVDAGASEGKPRVINFTPVRAGTFAFYCSKKAPFTASHREKGMEGVLEVRAD